LKKKRKNFSQNVVCFEYQLTEKVKKARNFKCVTGLSPWEHSELTSIPAFYSELPRYESQASDQNYFVVIAIFSKWVPPYLCAMGNCSFLPHILEITINSNSHFTLLKLFFSHSGGLSPAGSTRHVGHWLAYCKCPEWLWWWRI
jgi:hypothetical protein